MAVFSPDGAEKIHGLILNKLFLKVGDGGIFSNKVKVVSDIFENILRLGDNYVNFGVGYEDTDALINQEFKDLYVKYGPEIRAYIHYLKFNDAPSKELVTQIIILLNDDLPFFEEKLHEIILKSLKQKNDFKNLPHHIIENYMNYIKLLAEGQSTQTTLQALYTNIHQVAGGDWLKNIITHDVTLLLQVADKEINAYRKAHSLIKIPKEFYDIFFEVRLLLN